MSKQTLQEPSQLSYLHALAVTCLTRLPWWESPSISASVRTPNAFSHRVLIRSCSSRERFFRAFAVTAASICFLRALRVFPVATAVAAAVTTAATAAEVATISSNCCWFIIVLLVGVIVLFVFFLILVQGWILIRIQFL